MQTTLRNRLKRLEAGLGADIEFAPLFVSFGGIEGGKISFAVIPGTSHGQIDRDDDETEGEFCRRVYGLKVPNKLVEGLTDCELEYSLAASDEEIALEMATTGKISEDNLRKAVGD